MRCCRLTCRGIDPVVGSVVVGSGGGLQRKAPRRSDVGELHRWRVGERDRVGRRTDCAAPLEESDTSVAVQARGNPDRAGALIREVRGNRLSDGAAAGGDLMQIEVR